MEWLINGALFLLWIVLASAAWAGWTAAPWVPSKKRYRQLLQDHLPVTQGDVLFDLGCGTGTILRDFAKQYPYVTVHGVELSIVPYLVAKVRSLFYPNMHVRYGNLFSTDIKKADIVIVYLLDRAYPKLLKKLQQELRPNALVALEAWPFPSAKPWKSIEEKGTLPIHLYRGEDLIQ